MKKKIRIGVIGCGHWGQNYVRNFTQINKSKVKYCCDIDDIRIKNLKKEFPFIQTCKDYQRVTDDPDIDGVVISTPAETHFKLAREALRASKHVLVEKPFIVDIDQGQELIGLAKQKNLILMVGHTFIYNTVVRKMKEIIDNNDFGEVYYLHSTRTHLGLIREDVNAIWDLAPHDISIFSYLLGRKPICVSATGVKCLKNRREDVVFMNIDYFGGIIGNIHVSWVNSNKVRKVEVIGSKKRIVFDDLDHLEPLKIFEKGVSVERSIRNFGEFKYLLRDGDIISPKIEMNEPLKNQCNHFLECIINDRKPLTDGENGLEVVKVLIAADTSLRLRGAPVEIK